MCKHIDTTLVKTIGLGGWNPIEIYKCDECGVELAPSVKGFIGRLPDDSVIYTNAPSGCVDEGYAVFRAGVGAVADVESGYLIGRWVCSVRDWNRYFHRDFDMQPLAA